MYANILDPLLDMDMDIDSNNDPREKFMLWLDQFKIDIALEKFSIMFQNFVNNDKHIEDINSQDLPYKLGQRI